MKRKTCPYCREEFVPSRYHPEQTICSAPECQRRRRTEYHRKRIAEDPSYRDLCAESQTYWREKNPDYSKRRRARSNAAADAPEGTLDRVLRILRQAKNNSAKNNVAVTSSHCCVEVFWVTAPGAASEKNSLADAKLIVIQGDVLIDR